MAVISKINSLDGNTTYDIKDSNALPQSNVVTSVSSSSTNSQVPSAKLFYDTIGDVESILTALLVGTSS